MYEQFTDRARKVMQLANLEAQRLNSEHIGTEHVLLGLVKVGSGVAALVLQNLGVEPQKVTREVEKCILRGDGEARGSSRPQTPRVKKALELAIQEARNFGHQYVGTEHLLLGLLGDPDGFAANVLMNLDLRLEHVRAEVQAILGRRQAEVKSEQAPESRSPSKRNRVYQLLLLATFMPLCWLAMQAVHELGHVAAATASGGTVTKVVLHPLTISRTETTGSSHPMLVVWAGPAVGVAFPLVLLAVFKAAKWRWDYLVQFFAGFCLIANGAYLAAGSFQRISDAGDLVRLGCPPWSLWLFGAATVPLGLYLWNGLGPKFGLGSAGGKVDHRAAYLSAVLLLLVVVLEAALSSSR